jgi:hypothetical protein
LLSYLFYELRILVVAHIDGHIFIDGLSSAGHAGRAAKRHHRQHDRHGYAGPLTSAKQGRNIMRTSSLPGGFIISLLVATALTPVSAANMTNERTLNPQREPQNWILHHGNYQGPTAIRC